MKRVALKMRLKPGCTREYEQRHKEFLPELKQLLKETRISDYSILFDAEINTLFAVQKQDGDAYSKDLGSDPNVKKWRKHIANFHLEHYF
jgi:L-rhamnose mutarotase